MNFPSIDIQGSILSIDLLARIRSAQANFQLGKDFNADLTDAKLKDEISLAWQEAKGQWTIYKSKLTRLKEGETGTSETRNFWISPLLANLDYNLTYNKHPEELNGKPFRIGYRDNSIDDFPIYVGGYNDSLDKRPVNKQIPVSPHAMLQEYLNYSEHLYGIVTNGRQLRLLRDANRITRLSYVEFNLEKMMDEDLYSDFVILYRLLHVSRMPKKIDAGADSIIEKYHQIGLEAGSTIRNKLGEAVKAAIKNLANGFINHPKNTALREAVALRNIDVDEYYRHQLRIIYRLLFLFVIEERNLVYADSKTPETKRFNQIYFNYYSLLRLRKLAGKLLPPEADRYYDLWQSLVSTFSLFEQKEIGEKLGIMSLEGDLFGYNAIINNQYDMHKCYLSNDVLLNIVKSLCYFENDNGVLIAVNYGGLDVEEFGSIYEGLLELKLEFKKIEGSDNYSVNWKKQVGGREFQSHYTPEELVQPLIKHSLEYLIEDIYLLYTQNKVSKENTIIALLKLKVCDVACGSGHILLSAARRIALTLARVITDEEQPNPMAIRKAMKDVVRNCIYGVDKNLLAVELCKIALWLEAYNPGEPLNFLDHHIKCGDAIVGLAHSSELEKGIANEAFKTLDGDDKDIASYFRKKNKTETGKRNQFKIEFKKEIDKEIKNVSRQINEISSLPESTTEEVERKKSKYLEVNSDKDWWRLKILADIQIAQFFISMTVENKNKIITDSDYFEYLFNEKQLIGQSVAEAMSISQKNKFFHWFLEFPEVFNEGGFDCLMGNPPYLGGTKISSYNSDSYFNFCKTNYFPAAGRCDLVGYFVRRIYLIQKENGFHSIITTNTIAEGDTREGGLDVILNNDGKIVYAEKGVIWPGKANVIVTLYSLVKGAWSKEFYLSKKNVSFITSYLTEDSFVTTPFQLKQNEKKAFMGSSITGDGFLIDKDVYESLINNDIKYADVIFKYINGFDFNNRPNHLSEKRIINFFDGELSVLRKNYPLAIEIVENLVKPERDQKSIEVASAPWWKYWRIREDLYSAISNNKRVLVLTRATSTHGLSFLSNENFVYSDAVVVYGYDTFSKYSVLQSSMHEDWAWRFSSKLKNDRRYSVTDAFETYPFPETINSQQDQQLVAIGEAFHEHRRQLMMGMQLGLTKTYNLFHSNAITAQRIDDKDKQVAYLKKHVEKTDNTISFNEALQGILKFRELHVKMDEAVLDAYGWTDISLKHDFYEVDYLPENDRVRFTIHPDARREILKRLLELNHKIHEEEVAAGLWDNKKKKTKPKKKTDMVREPEAGYGLFQEEK